MAVQLGTKKSLTTLSCALFSLIFVGIIFSLPVQVIEILPQASAATQLSDNDSMFLTLSNHVTEDDINFKIKWVNYPDIHEVDDPDPVSIDVTIENSGIVSGTAHVTTEIVNLANEVVFNDTKITSEIKAGLRKTANFNWIVPSNAVNGTYFINVVVKDDNEKTHDSTEFLHSFSVGSTEPIPSQIVTEEITTPPVSPFFFLISTDPRSIIVNAGDASQVSVKVSLRSGTPGSVLLDCSLPSSVSLDCSFDPDIVTPAPTAISTLTIPIKPGAHVGRYAVTVTGISEHTTDTTKLDLRVTYSIEIENNDDNVLSTNPVIVLEGDILVLTPIGKIGVNDVPQWVRSLYLWYEQELISEKDFVQGISYLAEQGIIRG